VRAAAIIDRIVERAESLASLPNRGRTPPELRSIGDRTWRELQEPPWRIIYRRLDEVVQIHAVLDGRRNLGDVLMERMLKS
jgi:toxin ParE1/3/4